MNEKRHSLSPLRGSQFDTLQPDLVSVDGIPAVTIEIGYESSVLTAGDES